MSFVDSRGNKWDTSVTVGSIRRVKNATDIDLAQIFDEKVYTRLVGDPFALVDVIASLLEPQLEKAAIKIDDFLEFCDGETIEKATESLITSIAEFFPAPKRAPLLHVWERTQSNQKAISEAAMRKIDLAMDYHQKEMLEKMESIDPSTFGKSSGGTQELPE